MALNGLGCAAVPLRDYCLTHSLTHSPTHSPVTLQQLHCTSTSNCTSWYIAVCMVWALNISRRISSSCPRFSLTRDCIRPPVPMSWFLPCTGLHLATVHFRSQELEHGTRHCSMSPPRHLFPHSGDSWKHFCSSDNFINIINYCIVVPKCLHSASR